MHASDHLMCQRYDKQGDNEMARSFRRSDFPDLQYVMESNLSRIVADVLIVVQMDRFSQNLEHLTRIGLDSHG